MGWAEYFNSDNQPSEVEISGFINSPLWQELNMFLKDGYGVEPVYSYSTCSGQPGWNVKYKKAGRALCTLYPMDGFFIALVVVGANESFEAEGLVPTFCEYIRNMLSDAPICMGVKWLMIHVTDSEILEDVKTLIQVRRKIKA